MPSARRAAVFLGSFLAFSLELIVAKLLLPLYGGSAAVWTTCLVFFQAAVAAAALYGHAVLRAAPRRGPTVHAGLLLLAFAFFPLHLPVLALGPLWVQVIAALAGGIAVPFFMLSTTTVTLQWWAREPESARRDAASLYAYSNAGAFAALLSYPFLIEPRLSSALQLQAWYALYALYAALHYPCRPSGQARSVPAHAPPVSRRDRAVWAALSAAPCLALVACTNYLAFNIASLPLVWVLPLSIYLLTLVLSFKERPSGLGAIYRALALCAIVFLAILFIVLFLNRHAPKSLEDLGIRMGFLGALALNIVALFVLALLCHKRLAQKRPENQASLPLFYFCAGLGGLCGSALMSIALPLLARHAATLRLDWTVAGAGSLAAVFWSDAPNFRDLWRRMSALQKAFTCASLVALAAGLRPGPERWGKKVFALRNFYGIYSVKESTEDGLAVRRLFHGNTLHGMQYVRPDLRRFAISYYHPHSPIADIFAALGPRWRRVATVGLGAGSIAAYGRSGQAFDFFELDPDMEKIARGYFTYLADSAADVRVVIGDGRLSLAREAGPYDAVILDAFSSDAVPVHLLTREAFALYLTRLGPGGVIICHISNRLLDLRAVVAEQAQEFGLSGAIRAVDRGDLRRSESPSQWAILAREPASLRPLLNKTGWQDLQKAAGAFRPRPWTDQYTAILPIIGI